MDTVRNSNGEAIFWGSLCLGMTSSALEVEALTLLVVVQILYLRGFDSIVFERECINLVKMMNDHDFFYNITVSAY